MFKKVDVYTSDGIFPIAELNITDMADPPQILVHGPRFYHLGFDGHYRETFVVQAYTDEEMKALRIPKEANP